MYTWRYTLRSWTVRSAQCAALAVCCSPSHAARRRDRGGAPRAAVGIEYGCRHHTHAWPKCLEVGSPKNGDTSVLTEKLTLTAERLEVEYSDVPSRPRSP